MRIILLVGVLGIVGVVRSAYDTNTAAFISNLNTCIERTQSDIDCLEKVQEGFQLIIDTADQVRELKNGVTKVKAGVSTIKSVMTIANLVPGIGSTAIKVLKTGLKVVELPLSKAKTLIDKVDAKVYPMKLKVEPIVDKLGTAAEREGYLNGNCTNGEQYASGAITAVEMLSAGAFRSGLESGMEGFGGILNLPFDLLNKAFGNFGKACKEIEAVTDKVMKWPDLSGLKSGLKSFTDALDPILNFFQEIQNVMDKKVCVPNPFEAIAETELVQEVAEFAKKAVSSIGNWFKSWGRKRRSLAYQQRVASAHAQLSDGMEQNGITTVQKLYKKCLSEIAISEEKANSLIQVRAGNLFCVSVQDVLNGVSKVVNFVMTPINKILDLLLDALPSFSLPGLPSFDILDFDINFDLPSVTLEFDFELYAKFDYLNFNCPAQITRLANQGSGELTVACDVALEAFQSTFNGKRQLSMVSRDISDDVAENMKNLNEVPEDLRKDNKDLDENAAVAEIESMSLEAKKKLRAKLEAMGVDLTGVPPISDKRSQDLKKLEVIARMLAAVDDK